MKRWYWIPVLLLAFGVVACGAPTPGGETRGPGDVAAPGSASQPGPVGAPGATAGGVGQAGSTAAPPSTSPASPPVRDSSGVDIGEACHDPIEPGNCKNIGTRRFAWDKDEGRCVSFVYHCSKSRNNFHTMAGCRDLCPSSNGSCFDGDRSYGSGDTFQRGCSSCTCERGQIRCKPCNTRPSRCYEKPDSGAPCKASMTVWSFDATTGACQKRHGYGGCGKSRNLFHSEAECHKSCAP